MTRLNKNKLPKRIRRKRNYKVKKKRGFVSSRVFGSSKSTFRRKLQQREKVGSKLRFRRRING